nr:hypothetical protein [uncultured Pedobacter sp.]
MGWIDRRKRCKEREAEMPKVRSTIVLLIFLSLFLIFQKAQSQTWNEIFRQKKTQKRYLLEQIAAFKMYAAYLKKGYDITSSGLNTIKDFTNGEFNLHQTFITSLKAVNPVIRKHHQVAEIIIMQLSINKALNAITGSDDLSGSNSQYLQSVSNHVKDECEKDLEDLLLVISSGKMEMKDEERIRKLDSIYASMQDKSVFAQSFCNAVGLLIHQKEQEGRSLNQIKQWYEKE